MQITIDTPRIHDVLRLTRAARRIGLRQAASEMGMSFATLSRMENGGGFLLKWIHPVAVFCKLTEAELWKLMKVEAES